MNKRNRYDQDQFESLKKRAQVIKMNKRSMFDQETIKDLEHRMFAVLKESGQFEHVEMTHGAISIGVNDMEELRIEPIVTYPTGTRVDIWTRATGLRINLMYRDKTKRFMVPSYDRKSGKWMFSRTKLLRKASEVVSIARQQAAIVRREREQTAKFDSLVEDALGSLGKISRVSTLRKYPLEICIEPPWGKILLASFDDGKTFNIQCIEPRFVENLTPRFSLARIKETLENLGQAFEQEYTYAKLV